MNSGKGRELILTSDGSHSLFDVRFGDTYHSVHGAVREAEHVYLREGLAYVHARGISRLHLLELGFGTALNALLSFRYARQHGLQVHYVSLEAYPLPEDLIRELNYPQVLGLDKSDCDFFYRMHEVPWGEEVWLSPNFVLEKRIQSFEELDEEGIFDLLYYDAFGPVVQPHLWGEEMVWRVYRALSAAGVLTTFCAQGAFRRNLESVGFRVRRLAGPPGKREMLRAEK